MSPLWIAILTCLGLFIVLPWVSALVLFLLPGGGRKGKMRTVREVAHDGMTVEQARTLYAGRLTYDGFIITNASEPTRLEAKKPKAPMTETFTHADKGLSVAIDFAPEPGGRGVAVRIVMWMDDFVIFDTGEGRLIDMTLDRIVTAELDRDPPPVVPNRSLMAVDALISVLTALAIIIALGVGVSSPGARTAAVIVGAAMACVLSMMMSLHALSTIRSRPAELTGRGAVLATMIVGPLAVVVAAVTLYLRFGASTLKTLRGLLP